MKKLKLKHKLIWKTSYGLVASKEVIIRASKTFEDRVEVEIEFVKPSTQKGKQLPCFFSSSALREYDRLGSFKEFFSKLFTDYDEPNDRIMPTIIFGRCWWAAVAGDRFNFMGFNERGGLDFKLSLHTKDAKKFIAAFNQVSEVSA